jgi:hypothetical protein
MGMSRSTLLRQVAPGFICVALFRATASAQVVATGLVLELLGSFIVGVASNYVSSLLLKTPLGGKEDDKCLVSPEEIDALRARTEVLNLALAFEGRGVIPDLKNYLKNPNNEEAWLIAKASLANFVGVGDDYLRAEYSLLAKMKRGTHPDVYSDLVRLARTINNAENLLIALAQLPNKPDKDTVNFAGKALELFENQLGDLQSIASDLRKAAQLKCQ